MRALAVASALMALTVSSAARQRPPETIDTLFVRGRAVQKSMQSLRANFRETTVSSLLVDPLISSGTVTAALNPLRLVMRYSPPDGRTIWIDERLLVVSSPARPTPEQIDIASTQRRIQKYFTDASLDELRSSFDMALRADPSRPAAHLLEMTPRRSQIKAGLERLRLWIDKERLLMVRLDMIFPGGDSTRIDLSDIEVNVPIDAQTFARPGKGGGA
jgi:outer membrane lipoprotein-sorting protein